MELIIPIQQTAGTILAATTCICWALDQAKIDIPRMVGGDIVAWTLFVSLVGSFVVLIATTLVRIWA